MSAKDRDIQRLKEYINKLGLKLYTRPYSRDTGAAEYVEGQFITIFESRNTKTDLILSLLHELGHHLDWLANKPTPEENKAIELLNTGAMVGDRSDIPKESRRIILQIEKNGVKYMSKIHRDLKLEIPFWKVKMQQDLDLIDYRHLYHTGRFANKAEHQEMQKGEAYYKKKYGRKKRRV